MEVIIGRTISEGHEIKEYFEANAANFVSFMRRYAVQPYFFYNLRNELFAEGISGVIVNCADTSLTHEIPQLQRKIEKEEMKESERRILAAELCEVKQDD